MKSSSSIKILYIDIHLGTQKNSPTNWLSYCLFSYYLIGTAVNFTHQISVQGNIVSSDQTGQIQLRIKPKKYTDQEIAAVAAAQFDSEPKNFCT